jgi:hypothetical protein
MGYKILYIFVEGNDDEEFFQKIFLPKLRKKNDDIKIIKYAQKPKKFKYIGKFVKSIQSMGADYIYATDIDNSQCVTAKKQETQNKLRNIDSDKIIVVIKEIESWYLAGLSDTECRRFQMRTFSVTDDITKEQFDSLRSNKFDSRIDFMSEILKQFSIKIAKQKNKSLRYYIARYNCEASENVDNSV